MVEMKLRVRQAESAEWVVDLPGGDQHHFGNKVQAEAFANAFRVFHDSRSGSGSIRDALERLQENELQIDLGRRLLANLKTAIARESSW